MRFCSHTLTSDIGLAPNPFGDYCTLALGTPNHMGIRAEPGDWFVGISAKKRGSRLVYAMEVCQVLHFDEYFHDSRFAMKKPVPRGSWQQRCGDNIYYRDDRDRWQRLPSPFHQKPEEQEKDLRNPYAFIAEHFYYFGEDAVDLPRSLRGLITGLGVKCSHSPELVDRFLRWLQHSFEQGRHGLPHDRPR